MVIYFVVAYCNFYGENELMATLCVNIELAEILN